MIMISRLNFVLLIAALLLLIVIFFCSCTTAKKATNFMLTHPEVSAAFCAKEFPVKDSLIKGDSIILYDTLWGLSDPIIETVTKNDTVTITRTLPAKVITKTVKIVDTVIKESTSKLFVALDQLATSNNKGLELSRKNDELTASLSDMRKSRNKFRWWFYVAIGGVVVFTGLKLKKAIGI